MSSADANGTIKRKIENLTIESSGLSLNESDEMMVSACKRFRPTFRQLRSFFLSSYPVPGVYMANDFYSDCYATGTISFNDNKSSGKWILYSTGVARIDWNHGGNVYLLYKRNKWHDPMND